MTLTPRRKGALLISVALFWMFSLMLVVPPGGWTVVVAVLGMSLLGWLSRYARCPRCGTSVFVGHLRLLGECWAVDRPWVRRRCAICGHDLTANAVPVSEVGTGATVHTPPPWSPRKWALTLAACAVASAAGAGFSYAGGSRRWTILSGVVAVGWLIGACGFWARARQSNGCG